MIEELERVELFHGLTTKQFEEVSKFCTRVSLLDGDILIEETDKDDIDLYILISGSVEIVSNSANIISDEVVISKDDKEVFGEISWLTDAPRTASVRCHGGVQAIRVDGKALKAYLDKDTNAGYAVMRAIALVTSKRMARTDGLLKQILWNTCLQTSLLIKLVLSGANSRAFSMDINIKAS